MQTHRVRGKANIKRHKERKQTNIKNKDAKNKPETNLTNAEVTVCCYILLHGMKP